MRQRQIGHHKAAVKVHILFLLLRLTYLELNRLMKVIGFIRIYDSQLHGWPYSKPSLFVLPLFDTVFHTFFLVSNISTHFLILSGFILVSVLLKSRIEQFPTPSLPTYPHPFCLRSFTEEPDRSTICLFSLLIYPITRLQQESSSPLLCCQCSVFLPSQNYDPHISTL